jgi:hypothetical protein
MNDQIPKRHASRTDLLQDAIGPHRDLRLDHRRAACPCARDGRRARQAGPAAGSPGRQAAPHGHCAPARRRNASAGVSACQQLSPRRKSVRRTSPDAAGRYFTGEWHMHPPCRSRPLAPVVFRDCAGPRAPQADPIVTRTPGPLPTPRQSQPQDDDPRVRLDPTAPCAPNIRLLRQPAPAHTLLPRRLPVRVRCVRPMRTDQTRRLGNAPEAQTTGSAVISESPAHMHDEAGPKPGARKRQSRCMCAHEAIAAAPFPSLRHPCLYA